MDTPRCRSALTPPPATVMGRSSRLARKQRVAPAASIPMDPALDDAWAKKMYPAEDTTAHADRDVFGGHGMFEDMQPLIFIMALSGMIPVSFRPLRVSFHPLRSTLVLCVLYSALSLWSASRLLLWRPESERAEGDALALETRSFSSLVNSVHLGGLSMLPLLWWEARYARRNEALAAGLMAQFSHLRRRCWVARAACYVMAAVSLVVSPLAVAVWMTVVSGKNTHWSHMFVNHHVVNMEVCVTCLIFCLFHCVKNFAEDLSTAMVKELYLPYAPPCRVVAFRRAWLSLRDLTQGLLFMPLTTIALMLFVLLMFTLNAYMCLGNLLDGHVGLASVIFVIGTSIMLQLLIICDAVQRARDAVSKGFLQPLELFCTLTSIHETTSDEIHNFREIVASSPVIVSAAGFWEIDRRSISSILAASVGYLIVIIQFRSDSPECPTNGFRNDTATTVN
ncbi:Gustatory and odorant receptor 24 [Frankliniella fusca]|uniref:Gustatory receptor n=1 Tax=Frankliniella fusca TaxID=407009 RepID=A0AAE1HCH4_9NEOP|nr:Gustatory and odorant receptor 24 [Frankliniella fusca]